MSKIMTLAPLESVNRTTYNPDNPESWDYEIQDVKVADEDELLEFANLVRSAGGADPIPALLLSNPGDAKTCLLASALNFHSEVWPEEELGSGEFRWIMRIRDNTELAKRIASAVGVELNRQVKYADYANNIIVTDSFDLPQHIGNAAHAFDSRQAFTDFIC
jgi:hypothetical protein